MGKREELRLLRNSTSADAPVNYHHRTGDSEGSGGSMLDLYTQVQSVEDDLLDEEDKAAQGVFIRAFKLFLRQTLTGKERKFLNAVMSGKGKPHEIGRAMKINWFDCMQEIQRKAFANAEAFKRVATLSGWSRAELFSEAVFKRLRDMGGNPTSELSREKKQAKARAMFASFGGIAAEDSITSRRYNWRIWKRTYIEKHREAYIERSRAYRAEHREELNEKMRKYNAKNWERDKPKRRARYLRIREKRCAQQREAYAKNKLNPEYMKEKREKDRAYFLSHKEEIYATERVRRAKNRDKINARWRAYYEANKEHLKAMSNTPERKAKRQAYRQTEEYKAKARIRAKEMREKKKAEKLAAQALAGLMAISQTAAQDVAESI